MKVPELLVATALIAALAGCGKQEYRDTGGGNVASSGAITNYQQAVLNLGEAQRNVVFFRAIRDAGLPCQEVVRAERLPDEKDGPAWRAQCEDKSYHMIILHADGTAVVVSRTR